MANFLQGFLTHRTTRVKIGSHLSTSHDLVCGVPQGSVLSPTLFTIYLNDLFATLSENVNSSLYADDGALWTTSASLPEAVSCLQIALDRIAEWSHSWGLSVSPTKTNAIIFTLCRPPSPPPLFLSNSPLSYVSHVRFLGLIFDRHLTWHKHISIPVVPKIYSYSEPFLMVVTVQTIQSSAVSMKPSSYPNSTTVISSKHLPLCICNSNLLILDHIQYAATRILLGALRCKATYKFEAKALIMPLHIRRRQLLLQYGCRILSIPHHPARKLILHLPPVHYLRGTYTLPALLRLAGKFQFAHLDPRHVPLIPLHVRYRTNSLPAFSSLASHPKDTYTSSQWIQAFKHLHSTSYHAHTPLYADCSKSDTHCGCALWSDPFTLLARLPPSLSAFTAELYAIYIGLRFLHKHRPPDPFVLYTDSLSAIRVLQTLHRHSHHHLLLHCPAHRVPLQRTCTSLGIPFTVPALLSPDFPASILASYLLHSASLRHL